eukprot:754418-Hanusia_phi.AAC.1
MRVADPATRRDLNRLVPLHVSCPASSQCRLPLPARLVPRLISLQSPGEEEFRSRRHVAVLRAAAAARKLHHAGRGVADGVCGSA